jgi:hypothetical protein
VSSQDGSNRSQRPRRPSQPQSARRPDAAQRQNRTWDVDPAEIDRYLSGRPSRSEGATRRPDPRSTQGNTADQLSRLQNAVGRQPVPEPEEAPRQQQTYRGPSASRAQRPVEPQPAEYNDEGYDDSAGMSGDVYEDDHVTGYGYEPDYDEETVWDEPEAAPPARPASPPVRQPDRQRQPRPAQQRQSRAPRQSSTRYEPAPVDPYDEAEYDEEFYNDDPYLGYEDERIERRTRTAQRARPRPQVKLNKPNLPKVTIPKSVTESPLLADRLSLIMMGIAIVSIALMSFIVSDRIGLLGETIPTHVSATGEPENIMTRDAVWNIPLLAGMVMLMNIAASWFIARIDHFAARFLLAGGLLVHVIAWVALFKYLWE